jgi:hypothetical protein
LVILEDIRRITSGGKTNLASHEGGKRRQLEPGSEDIWYHSPIRRHKVLGLNGSESNDLLISPLVSLNTDSLYGQERDKRLRDVVVQSGLSDLFNVDGIGGLEDLDLFPGDFSQDSDGETGTGEGVTSDQMGGDVKQTTKSSNFV